MKKLLILILFFTISLSAYSQYSTNKFGIYIGASVGSYVGADFGSTFPISVNRYHDDYYYDEYYYYDDYDNRSGMSPIAVDLGMDYIINNNITVGLESSFIWHSSGKPARDYRAVISSNNSFIEKWDNSRMFAIPIFANFKIYPFGKKEFAMYLSGGYGMQYLWEGIDRVRDRNFENNYYYNSYSTTISSETGSKWLHGIKASLGLSIQLSPNLSNETEIKVSNFFPTKLENSHLSMYKTTNITFIALTTKVYFNF